MTGPAYHGRTHLPGGTDPIPGLTLGDEAGTPFNQAVTDLSATLDLRGYWRLGDGASPFADISGHANGAADMTRQVGAGTAMTQNYTPGALPTADDDGAVSFNVANSTGADYLQSTDPGTPRRFNLDATDMTLTAYVEPFASASSFLTGIVSQYWQGGWGSGGGWGFFLEWPTRRLQFRRGGNTGAYEAVLVGPILPTGEWTFLAATYDGTTGHKLYVNGELVAVDTTLHNNMPTFNNGVSIAKAFATGFTSGYYGGVDEVTVWGDALTAEQLAALAVAGGADDLDALDTVVATTTAYTALSSDDVILANGTFTVTLPTAVGITGHRITVKNTGSGTITVGRTSSETIDGAASNKTISTTKAALEFTSDGVGWQITAAYL